MNLKFEINEQLANALMAAAEFKIEVEKIIKSANENIVIADYKEDYVSMSDDIFHMMDRIGATMGSMITEIALDEVRKENNNLNLESHVSE